MSVVRFFILLAAVFTLLPSDTEQRKQLWEKSREIVSWTMSTCERNPQSCESANDLWKRVKQKSARSAALIGEKMTENFPEMPPATGSLFPSSWISVTSPVDTGTLLPSDLIPEWRG